MNTFLSILQAVLGILTFVGELIARAQGKAQGRKEVAVEIAEQQVQAHRDASEILAEQRPDRAASDRLRDGSF